MQLERKILAFDLKATSEDGGSFEGLAAAFYNPDESWYCDILAPGCFVDSLPEFLTSGFVGGMNHDWDQPIGKPTSAEETAEGLFVKATISDTAHGRDCRVLMKDGVVRKLSIGFRVLGRTWLNTLDEVVAWWTSVGYTPTAADMAKAVGGCRLITKLKLYEFSPVALPANPRAVISSVKSGEAPATGLSLRDHSEATLAAVQEYAERLQSLRETRAAEDRGLSPDHQAGFRKMRGMLDEILSAYGATEADPCEDREEKSEAVDGASMLAAAARLAEIEARLLGVSL